MTERADNIDAKPKRRTLRRVVAGAALCALFGAGAWYAMGLRVWTDDRTIRVRAGDAAVREILWTVPESLGEPFNTAEQDYEPSISPDGSELFFVRGKAGRNAEIFVSRNVRMKWTDPVPLAEVNTPHDDLGPRLTADGRFLLFYSDRPGGQGGYDVWAAQRREDGSFAAPFNLGPSINTEFNEYSPAPTPDGRRLYFATNRKARGGEQQEAWRATIRQDAVGDYDLFVALREELLEAGPTTAPVAEEGNRSAEADPTRIKPTTQTASPPPVGSASADRLFNPPITATTQPTTAPSEPALAYRAATEVPGVNTAYHEGASCVSTAGDFLYFASNRPGGAGRFDLYRCRLRDDGSLLPPENIGREINSADNETDPQLAVGGFRLYFSSDRRGSAARGGYDLLTSESREVYILRQDRALPHVGWSGWLLLGALLLLLPLLLLLRGWDDRRLNLLQKCLLVSLLVHVLLTILLSLIFVSREIVNYVRKGDGAGMEVAVVLEPAGGIDVGSEIRRQFTETPVEMPPPAELAPAQVPEEDLSLASPPAVKVDVPNPAPPPADAMRVQVPAVQRPAPRAASESVAVAPPVMHPVDPQLAIDASPRLSASEPAPRPSAEAAPIGRADSAPPSLVPQPVAIDLQSSAAQAGSLAEAAPPVRPNLMSIAPAALAARPAETPAIPPTVQGPSVPTEKVAAAPAEIPAVSPPVAGLERQPVESRGGEAAPAQPQSIASSATPVPADAAKRDLAAPGPTTRPITPDDPVAVAVRAPDEFPAPVPTVAPVTGGGPATLARADEPAVGAAEAVVTSSRQQADVTGDLPSPPAMATAAPAADAGSAVPFDSLASAAPSGLRPVEVADDREPPGPVALSELPKVDLPAPAGSLARASAEEPPAAAAAAEAPEAALATARVAAPPDAGPQRPQSIPSMTEPPATRPDALASTALEAGDARPRGEIVPVPLNLEIAIAAPRLAAPQPLSQRSVEARRPLVEKLGGTKQSEDAVERALAYLARQQEPDGRWTYVLPSSQVGRRGRYPHDMALTGLATLCFLAADHTPDKPGPYRRVVERGIHFLIAGQRANGDLRGPMAGGGADAGNLYDQGIGTLALAEAALMTGDARITAAAMKGADYIVKAQHRGTGGWRYVPGESGDTSIFGWQIMALHSAQQAGFDWPQSSREGALKYVRIASQGRHKSLAGYQPGHGPSPAMSAEMLFARILLGQELTPEAEEEVCRYLPRQNLNDFYGSYYASLSLVQLRNDAWKKWNERTREHLVRSQRRGGDDDGCWDIHITWGERGGRIYSTALACLTLEVYYRYLPVRTDGAGSTSEPAPELLDVGYLTR